MVVSNRKEIEDLIYKVFDTLDPSGINTEKYRKLFDSMSDTKFASFMKEFLNNKEENFTMDLIEFENNVSFNNAEKAAKILDIPLMEYVYMPHLGKNGKVVVTKEPCLVSYLNIKRTQQLLFKKNSLSDSADDVSALTGQVVNDDKNSRVSDMEGSLLISMGADKILKEFYGPRSDDMRMKREMNQSIATNGYVELDELTELSTNKITLNTINTFFTAMGLKTDLVSDTYILPKTSEEMF